jgi:hypothetical protein
VKLLVNFRSSQKLKKDMFSDSVFYADYGKIIKSYKKLLLLALCMGYLPKLNGFCSFMRQMKGFCPENMKKYQRSKIVTFFDPSRQSITKQCILHQFQNVPESLMFAFLKREKYW